MKPRLEIDLSAITDRIYIGRGKPGSNRWYGEERDVTEQAIHVVAEHILRTYPNGVKTLTVTDEKGAAVAYEIEVVKKEKPKKC